MNIFPYACRGGYYPPAAVIRPERAHDMRPYNTPNKILEKVIL